MEIIQRNIKPPKLGVQAPNNRLVSADSLSYYRLQLSTSLFQLSCDPKHFSRAAASHDMQFPYRMPPLSAVLYWEIGASCYQPPQKIPFINGTVLSEIICMTLTHQCFHFWSPASRLFASVSPLCDWAICQKKRALACYFRVRMGFSYWAS